MAEGFRTECREGKSEQTAIEKDMGMTTL